MEKIIFFEKQASSDKVDPLYQLFTDDIQIKLMMHIIPQDHGIILSWEFKRVCSKIASNRVHFIVDSHCYVRHQISHRISCNDTIFSGQEPIEYVSIAEALLQEAKKRHAIAWLDMKHVAIVSLNQELGVFLGNFLRDEGLENELHNQMLRS
jgi:hypothetical protein